MSNQAWAVKFSMPDYYISIQYCELFSNAILYENKWYFLLPDSHLWPFGVSLSLSWSLQLRHWFGDGPVHVLHWTAHLRQILSEVKLKFSNCQREMMKRPPRRLILNFWVHFYRSFPDKTHLCMFVDKNRIRDSSLGRNF